MVDHALVAVVHWPSPMSHPFFYDKDETFCDEMENFEDLEDDNGAMHYIIL